MDSTDVLVFLIGASPFIIIILIIAIIIYTRIKNYKITQEWIKRQEILRKESIIAAKEEIEIQRRINERKRKLAQQQRKRQQAFLSGFEEWSAKEFMSKKNSLDEITGVYILYNKTKNMYYVGQSVRVKQRVSSHLSGRGNGDVYADYKYGDEFTVKLVPLNKSGFGTLDELEQYMIKTFNSYSLGYNKTRGNTIRR